MEFLFSLLVDVVLVIPGTLAYKFFTGSKKTVKELYTNAPPSYSLIGGGVIVVLSFIIYQIFSYFF